jgi:ketosteroid isomerase-like protein
VALYEPAAVFEPQPGVVVEGRQAIRQALAEVLALRPTMVAETVEVLQGDDVALVINEWTMTGTAPDGSEVRQGGRSSDVVRRQPGGEWLVLVDKPA